MTRPRHLEPGWDMHERGDERVRSKANRLAAGARVAGGVVCHQVYGLGMYIDDRDEYGHVDIPFIKPGRIWCPEDFPPIGSRVEGIATGYTPSGQLRVVLYLPPTSSWRSLDELAIYLTAEARG
jgi:hypothetical protein